MWDTFEFGEVKLTYRSVDTLKLLVMVTTVPVLLFFHLESTGRSSGMVALLMQSPGYSRVWWMQRLTIQCHGNG